jgi:hypothetical protein
MSAQLPENIFSGSVKKMVNYTGVRIEQYQTIKASRKALGAEEYAKLIKALNKREEVARIAKDKREAAAEKKYLAELAAADAARAAKQEAARIRRNEKAKERRAAKKALNDVVVDIKTTPITEGDSDAFEIDIKNPIVTGLQKLVGQSTAYLQFSINGKITKSKMIEVKGGDGESIYWNSVFSSILLDKSEGQTIFYGTMVMTKNGKKHITRPLYIATIIPLRNTLNIYSFITIYLFVFSLSNSASYSSSISII